MESISSTINNSIDVKFKAQTPAIRNYQIENK